MTGKNLGLDSTSIIIGKYMGSYLGVSCRCQQPVCDQSFRPGYIYGGPFLSVGTGCELEHKALIVEIFNNTVYPAIAQSFHNRYCSHQNEYCDRPARQLLHAHGSVQAMHAILHHT